MRPCRVVSERQGGYSYLSAKTYKSVGRLRYDIEYATQDFPKDVLCLE
jgi:hypothetical protein